MSMPLPPGVATPPVEIEEDSGKLSADEYGFILDACLKGKHRNDGKLLAFIDSFVRCKNVGQASDEAGVKYSVGYSWRHRNDIANAIQKLIDRSIVKHGFDASELMERAKEIVDFDPIAVQNPDGTFKSNFHDIDPAARRNIKKLKVKNLFADSTDLNGMTKKIIIGEIIEYEFYDKLKAVDMAGREKDMFKTTTKVEHTVSKDMAAILLEGAKRGADRAVEFKNKVVDVAFKNVTPSTEESDHDGEE